MAIEDLRARLLRLLERLGRHAISTYAAALAYYTVLSLVPIFIFIFTVGTFFVDKHELERLMSHALQAILPSAAGLTAMLEMGELAHYRNTLGALSLLTTIWSASGMFTVLEAAVNAAWERGEGRSFLRRRIIGILSLIGLLAWLILAFFTRSLWHLLPRWFPIFETLTRPTTQWVERLLAFATILAMNLVVFRFFPARRVHGWIAALIAVGVSVIWMVVRELFTWALSVGVLKYPLFYGPLWVLVAPLIWAYWSYLILLLGAELQAFLEEDGFDRDEAIAGLPDLF